MNWSLCTFWQVPVAIMSDYNEKLVHMILFSIISIVKRVLTRDNLLLGQLCHCLFVNVLFSGGLISDPWPVLIVWFSDHDHHHQHPIITIASELLRNAESQTPFWVYGVKFWILPRFPGWGNVPYSLRSTNLGKCQGEAETTTWW